MKYEVKPSRHGREWVVEAFVPEGDGEVYVAEFSGPDAQTRAIEYAAWKNNPDQHTVEADLYNNLKYMPTVLSPLPSEAV